MQAARANVCRISEYGNADVVITEQQARLVQAAAGSRLRVTPTLKGYRIDATSYVGALSVPGLTLHIDPKVPVRNLFHLLTWSTHRLQFDAVEVDWAAGDLTAAAAAVYAQMLENALTMGVDRGYVEEHDRLVALRGRIDWPAQSRYPSLPIPLACRFDEWSVDTAPNRLTRAAAGALLRHRLVPFPTSHTLRRLMQILEGAGPLRSTDLAADLHLTRMNDHYRAVARLARVILTCDSLTHRSGDTSASAFLIDMNDVFEDFVHASLTQVLKGSLKVSRHRVVPLGTRGEIRSEPDFLFTDVQGNDVLVADTKYKLTKSGRGRSNDYYQLHAYCTSLNLPRGILIYCDPSGDLPPRHVEVRHNNDILETYRLSVSGNADDIAAEVRRLAAHVKATALATSPVGIGPAVMPTR